MKKIVRLTESDLHRIVKKSVNKVLNENLDATEEVMMDEACTSLLNAINNLTNKYGRKGNYEFARLTEKLYQDINKAINDYYGAIDAQKEYLAYNH